MRLSEVINQHGTTLHIMFNLSNYTIIAEEYLKQEDEQV
jgi:hypothetical protein